MRIAILAAVVALGVGSMGSVASAAPVNGAVIGSAASNGMLVSRVHFYHSGRHWRWRHSRWHHWRWHDWSWHHRHCWWHHGHRACD
jgi:hypothetical protein